MRRSLTHYWRTHLAVLFGAATTTAVLTGALIVGDSLRGSLRDLTLDRLGSVEWAIVAEPPFRQSLADDLGRDPGVGPGSAPAAALTLRASATAPESGARASEVALWGVDESFFALHPATEPLDLATRSGPFATAALNRALAAELGVAPGSELVLAFQRPSDVSRETLVGREESAETVEVLRVTVGSVLPDRGMGGFGLEPRQTRALNVFVDLERLQRALLGRGSRRVNTLLGGALAGANRSVESLESALASALQLEDLGLSMVADGEVLTVQSREFVLDDVRAEAVTEAARELGAEVQPVLTYLANAIELRGAEAADAPAPDAAVIASVPYSTIAALEPPAADGLGAFRLVGGAPAPSLGNDEILLNQWTADDLGAKVGDVVEVSYWGLGARDELLGREPNAACPRRRRHAGDGRRRLPALLTSRGSRTPRTSPLGIRRSRSSSTPSDPSTSSTGMTTARCPRPSSAARSAASSGPAVSAALRHCASRRRRPAPATGAAPELAAELGSSLRARLTPREAGFVTRPLREEGLRAARGATDFAGLFLGLSLFLIVSAALLAGLLFRLGVEHRAAEVGLLRATGFPNRRVRRRFLGEGLLLAALGAGVGLAGAAAYAGRAPGRPPQLVAAGDRRAGPVPPSATPDAGSGSGALRPRRRRRRGRSLCDGSARSPSSPCWPASSPSSARAFRGAPSGSASARSRRPAP